MKLKLFVGVTNFILCLERKIDSALKNTIIILKQIVLVATSY